MYIRPFKKYLLMIYLIIGNWMVASSVMAQPEKFHQAKIQALYDFHETQCVKKGWKKIVLDVNGLERQILWNGPTSHWTHGAIIAMHGGGGTFSNYCSNIRAGQPMVEFGELAVKEGFAVFSLDSGRDLSTDQNGYPCGKRWDFTARGRPNVDVDFIHKVITEIIPEWRPISSSEKIFMTGISNGGFMTIRAVSEIDDMITAFAPVSAGDPFGTHMDCADTSTGRKNAPGRWYDNETRREISKTDSCKASEYRHEQPWPETATTIKPPFKQFHHIGDIGVDISCMKKAGVILSRHGFQNKGPFVIADKGGKRLWKHFWLRRYNRPLMEFFKNSL